MVSLCDVIQLQKLSHLSEVVSLCGGVIQLQKVGRQSDVVSLCGVIQLQKLGHLSDVVSLCGVIQLQKLGYLLRVGGSSTTLMHGQIMQLVAGAAIKVSHCRSPPAAAANVAVVDIRLCSGCLSTPHFFALPFLDHYVRM